MTTGSEAPPRTPAQGQQVNEVTAFFAAAKRVLAEDDGVRGVTTGIAAYQACAEHFNAAGAAVPSIVVVGEVGRGKSTLVNALLGIQEASPSGPGETTGTYIAFQPATDALPAGQAEVELLDGEVRRVPAAEIEQWVRVQDALDRGGPEALALGARVGVADPPFPGVTLVDTPGTGGLNPDHVRVALARAAAASILVMVTDAGGVLTAPALRFLETCSSRVAAVVVVVTKIDQFPEWRVVVDDTRRALATSVDPRLRSAPTVPASAIDRLGALAASTPERAARRDAGSRFDGLLAELQHQLAPGDRLGRANGIRRLQAHLEALTRALEADLATLASPQGVAQSEGDLDRLKQLKAQNATWRLELEAQIGIAKQDVTNTISERLREFGDRWQSTLDGLRFGARSVVADRLYTDMSAELFTIIEDGRALNQLRMTEVVQSALAGLGLPEVLDDFEVTPGDAALFDIATRREAKVAWDLGAVMSGLSGARMVVYLAPAAALAGVAGGPLLVAGAIVAGTGVVALNLLSRGLQQRKQHLQTDLSKRVGELRAVLMQEFDRRVLEIRPALVRLVDAAIQAELARVTQRVNVARSAAQAGEQARRDRVDEVRHRVLAARRAATAAGPLVERLLA